MIKDRLIRLAVLGAIVVGAFGCKNLPSNESEREQHRLLGALIGEADGAGGGCLIGANVNKIKENDSEAAAQAITNATRNPATPARARRAATADINRDEFITLDEVVAMKKGGLNDDHMLARLQATGQIFELTSAQQQYLRDQGVNQRVIAGMPTLNQAQRQQILDQPNSLIGTLPSPSPASHANSAVTNTEARAGHLTP